MFTGILKKLQNNPECHGTSLYSVQAYTLATRLNVEIGTRQVIAANMSGIFMCM